MLPAPSFPSGRESLEGPRERIGVWSEPRPRISAEEEGMWAPEAHWETQGAQDRPSKTTDPNYFRILRFVNLSHTTINPISDLCFNFFN